MTQQLPYIYSATPPDTPPPAPFVWILPAGANGENWMFRYNGNSGSVYKWELIGGSPLVAGPVGGMTLSATGNTVLTSGPFLTLPRPGDYIIEIGIIVNAGSAQFLDVNPFGTVAGVLGPTITLSPPGGFYEDAYQVSRSNGLAAQGIEIVCSIANSTVSTGFQSGQLKITPVRVQ
ncbi:MAG: hypothetical protein ACREP9_15145 [Candidatus Dormibacteraceae bacterium]